MVEADTGSNTGGPVQCSAVCVQSRALIKMLHSNKDRKIMALYSDYYLSLCTVRSPGWGVSSPRLVKITHLSRLLILVTACTGER